jgi:hypothetical protein
MSGPVHINSRASLPINTVAPYAAAHAEATERYAAQTTAQFENRQASFRT